MTPMLDCWETDNGRWQVVETATKQVVGTGDTCEFAWADAADKLFRVLTNVREVTDIGSLEFSRV